MILKNEDDKMKVVVATCGCCCQQEIHVTLYKGETADEPNTYYVTTHNGSFDTEQDGVFKIIGRRLKRAWRALRGKDYLMTELVLNETEYKSLVKAMGDMSKRK